jgi:hypothetical protein
MRIDGHLTGEFLLSVIRTRSYENDDFPERWKKNFILFLKSSDIPFRMHNYYY